MPFTENEKELLLAQKGVGSTVIQRLEEIGIQNFQDLSARTSEEIVELVASKLHSSCWKNSPQAKAAIERAIQVAKTKTTHQSY